MHISFDVAGDAGELLVGVYAAFRLLALLQDALGLFLIVPETRLRSLGLKFRDKLAMAGNVKDSSARGRFAALIPQTDVPSLR
jgi:hypothetical protein